VKPASHELLLQSAFQAAGSVEEKQILEEQRMNWKRDLRPLFLALCLCLSLSTMYAQNTAGSVVGHIMDSTGSAIAGAAITITNVDTHETRAGLSSGTGDYTFSLLKPGTYSLIVIAKGFKTANIARISLDVDQTVRGDMSLSVGSREETVNVSSSAAVLDTDSSSVGQVIDSKQIQDLPLNGRNFQDLLFLAPGAVNNPTGEQSTYRIVISGGGDSSISLGGSRGSSNGYTVDGTTILDIGYDTPAFAPSLDSIDEFKEQTKGYSAAYGYSSSQINVSSKAGTNIYHGTIFEFLRNTAADATPHGSTPGVTVPLLQRNQFGYAFGGPLRIPRLYDGRNKTFFFANYEGFRQNVAGGSTAVVPTSDELNGIFSPELLGTFTAASATTQCGVTYNAGDQHPLFDPQTGCAFPLTNGSYVIPAGRISRLGKIAQRPGLYFPGAPNVDAPLGSPNFSVNASTRLSYDQQNYRIDQSFGEKDSFFIHAVKHDENESTGAITPVSGQTSLQPARLYTATETHIFTPHFTNQIRLGFLEALFAQQPSQAITTADQAALAFPDAFTQPVQGYPDLQFNSSPLSNGIPYSEVSALNTAVSSDLAVWDFGESAICNVGNHTISFGFGMRSLHFNLKTGAGLGRVNFDGQYSGDAFADLLLGVPSNLGLVQVAPLTNPDTGPYPHIRFRTLAPYVQDDWKATQRLTLNLGLRYEYSFVPYEEQNLFWWPDFNVQGGAMYVADPKIVSQYGGMNAIGGGGLYVNPPNGARGAGPGQKFNFAPRIGFAYRLFGDDKTVLRGGYGIFYDTIEANDYSGSSGFYPLSTGITTTSIPLTYPPAYSTDSLPTAGSSGPVTSYATDPNSPLGFLGSQAIKTLAPYFQSWELGVERELPHGVLVEADYVGNEGTHLYSRSNPNAPTQCIAANGCTVTFTAPPSVPVGQRTPYANFGTFIYSGFNGYSNYNALDAKVEHRSEDLTLLASYTWSQALDVKSAVSGFNGDSAGWAGPQDGHNIAADYGRSSFDVGQRLALSSVYALPVGRGKKLLSSSSTLVNEAIGGWSTGAIASFQGGLPFTIIAQDVQGANNTFSERADANLSHAPAGFKSTHDHYFSFSTTPGDPTAQYTQPQPGYYGTSQRNVLRSPGQANFDLSLFKSFEIYERSSFQLRVDAFNILNHWNPGQPDNDMFSATAAQILPTNSQSTSRQLQLSGRFSF
jgi:hypothetical protein